MPVKWKGRMYDALWQATDDEILHMLERECRPVPTGMVGCKARVGNLLTHFQIKDSLHRLCERGLIRRLEFEQAVDLFEVVTVEAWQFVRALPAPQGEGAHDAN